jgi:hypothetical protein
MSGSRMNDCITAVIQASGRDDLTDAQLDSIFSRAQARTGWYQRQGMDSLAAAQRAGTELGTEIRMAAAIERRAEAVNLLARRRLDARVIPGNEYDSVVASLTGVQRGTARGLADSVDANWHGLRGRMLGGLTHDLEAAGLLRAFRLRDAAFERDLAREMWRLRDPALPGTGNRHAEEMARIMGRHQDALRHELNEAGAWIGRQDHYITRQSHDQLKVRGDGSDAAFAAWRDYILPRLDPVTFRDTDNPAQFLRNVWNNLASGIHTTSTSETLAGFSGPSNLAKRVSQERVLIFRDADGWVDYNGQFGRGAVADAIVAQIEKGARDVALMRQLGTNPEAMLQGWRDRLATSLRDSGRVVDAEKMAKAGYPDSVLKVLDGRAALPGSATLAQAGALLRAWQQVTKLGGVVLSSIPDLAVQAAMLRHNGVPLFHAYAQEMVGLLPRGPETQQVARSLGVGIDGLLGDVALRLGADDNLTGRMAKASQLFYKLNGLTFWTDSMKRSAGLMLSSNLADNAARGFADLPGRLQATLRRYGIEAAEWDQIRASPQRTADGTGYLLPEAVGAQDASRKLAAYFADQVREGMTEPTAGVRAAVTLGTQSGTWGGELVRTLFQFKTFTTTYMVRSGGRELRRDGVDAGGLAHLIVATTALGYLAMTMKDLAKGRNPRQPDDAEGYAKLVAGAFVQGGGLGIYGDFLFGENNRFGGGFVSTLAGPTGGSVDEVAKFLANRIRGEGNAAAEAIRLGANHTPLVNLFYTRAALDYLVLWRMQEWANPGYLRRMEQRTRRENDQTFWLRPTEAVR